MTNSGGYNNIDETVAEAQDFETDDTALTESGEISTGANANEIFSDSAPGEESSAAGDSDDDGDDDSGNDRDDKDNQ